MKSKAESSVVEMEHCSVYVSPCVVTALDKPVTTFSITLLPGGLWARRCVRERPYRETARPADSASHIRFGRRTELTVGLGQEPRERLASMDFNHVLITC